MNPENPIARKITGQMCVEALKAVGKAMTAQEIAEYLTRTDARAVATAIRKPWRDGRIKTVRNRENWKARGVWTYKFVRMTAKKAGAA
jgi:hypothetical protein